MKTFREWLLTENVWKHYNPDMVNELLKTGNKGAGLTFMYDPEYDDLETDSGKETHFRAFNTTRHTYEYKVAGRCTTKGDYTVGICALWRHPVTENYGRALKKLIEGNYIDGNYEVTIDGEFRGTASRFEGVTPILDVEVDIPNYGKEMLHNIPKLMHTLPENDKKQAIKSFICNNYKKYSLLSAYVDRAGCGKQRPLDALAPYFKKELAPDNINSLRDRDVNKLFTYYLKTKHPEHQT
jgi:hypothetical protein